MSNAGSSTPYHQPSNSHKKKEEAQDAQNKPIKPKLEKIITGEVTQKKPSLGARIKETFTGDDSKSVANYIFFEVILPSAKSMIADAFTQGIERMLFGSDYRRPGVGSSSRSHVPYSSISTRNRPEPRSMSQTDRAQHRFDNIVFGTRAEANEVLDKLVDLVDQYDVASVSDLYALVGLAGTFQDEKWGWYDLRSARVQMSRGAYCLILPRPQPIE